MLNELINSIIEDGVVDAAEVEKLKVIVLADGVVDKDEADMLFAINDACSGAANDPSWDEFFVSAITDHVLADVDSPNEIDLEEAQYILAKVVGDGKVDALEKKLLSNLKAKATKIHPLLADKLDFLSI